MPRYSANLSILFPELPFLDRFEAAAEAGFQAVECWFPYEHPVAALRELLDANALKLVGINTSPGGGPGDWGLAAVPGREAEFDTAFVQALDYAAALGADAVHVLAGQVAEGGRAAAMDAYVANLERACRRAEGTGVTLLIEPLNGRDRPGYLVATSDLCGEVIGRVGAPNLRMMFDVYHVQISEGDLTARLRRHFPVIGHIQIAGVPDRAEPDTGEVNYAAILAEIDRLGWPGYVGCEYKPRGSTRDGLAWRERLAGG
jgi:2-dehydrotetronate isomerase